MKLMQNSAFLYKKDLGCDKDKKMLPRIVQFQKWQGIENMTYL